VNINISTGSYDHFWEEPPLGHMEFWAFRFKPSCQMGEEIIFRFKGQVIAKAKVAFIEGPGHSRCAGTGNFERHWKVFWHPDTFVDLRQRLLTSASPGPLFSESK
jgi:hypothetical protein